MENTQKKFLHSAALRRAFLIVSDWVMVASIALVVVTFFLTYVFRLVGVVGNSMEPTLFDGDRLLLSSTSTVYQCGDIVVIDRYTEEPLIKRVIAVGGDTVKIKDSVVIVNGRELTESYAQFDDDNAKGRYYDEIKVDPGYLFVMGDNRDHSDDSRNDDIGLISDNDVIGKVVYRIWPPSRFGSFD